MYNRLQRFPPPPNVAPAHRLFPVVPVEDHVLAADEKSPLLDFRPAHDEVAIRAYYIFLHEGARHGSDVRHWFEAESQLLAEYQAA